MEDSKVIKHRGVVALEQRIADLRASLTYFERAAAPTAEEETLLRRIAELQEEVGRVRVRRQYAVDQLALRNADIAKLEQTLKLAEADPKIAQIVWFKLLLERDKVK